MPFLIKLDRKVSRKKGFSKKLYFAMLMTVISVLDKNSEFMPYELPIWTNNWDHFL